MGKSGSGLAFVCTLAILSSNPDLALMACLRCLSPVDALRREGSKRWIGPEEEAWVSGDDANLLGTCCLVAAS